MSLNIPVEKNRLALLQGRLGLQTQSQTLDQTQAQELAQAQEQAGYMVLSVGVLHCVLCAGGCNGCHS